MPSCAVNSQALLLQGLGASLMHKTQSRLKTLIVFYSAGYPESFKEIEFRLKIIYVYRFIHWQNYLISKFIPGLNMSRLVTCNASLK